MESKEVGAYSGSTRTRLISPDHCAQERTTHPHSPSERRVFLHRPCFIGGITGNTVNNQAIVRINTATGQLGTVLPSSARFKKDIKPMDKASECILALRPVTFNYREDNTNTLQFGLIAEEVVKVDPSLVINDKEGKPLSVRYEDINMRLLNEFLKERKTVQEQGATIARLEKQIEALSAGLQRVSAQQARASAQIEKPAGDT